MKKIYCTLLALSFILIASAAFAGDVPDLTGTWHCAEVSVAGVERGFYKNKANNNLIIEEQHGRVFLGMKQWTRKGKDYSEKLCGGIAPDGEVYIAEKDDGTMHGDLSADGKTLTVMYVESGPDAKVIELIYTRVE